MLKHLILASFLAFSPWLFSQSTFSVETGAQWEDVSGNKDVYRSQVNGDSGFLLHALHYAFMDAEGKNALMDRFQVNATGFGASPHGRVKLEAGHATAYRLKMDYSRYEHFNALESRDTPNSVIHAVDRTRQLLNVDLELFPQRALRPLIQYSWNSYDGPGRESLHFGGDEFAVDSMLDESETEIRVGLAYQSSRVQAEVSRGWRDFSGTERRTAQNSDGQNTRPVLGNDVVLDDYEGLTRYESETPVTRATFKAFPGDKISILATYVHADAESEVRHAESYGGSFTSFAVNRFFNGAATSVRSRTEAPSWRGRVRLEWELPADFQLDLGYERGSREMDGNALMETLYLDSVTFSNGDPRDYQDLIDATSRMERDEDVMEATITAYGLEHFRFWAALSIQNEELEVVQDLAQIVVSNGQGGNFTRDVDRIRAGAAYQRQGHQLSLEWQSEDADQTVMRTDFLDRETLNARFRTHVGDIFRLSAKARWLDGSNPNPAINYNMELFNAGIDLEATPGKGFHCRLSYGIFDLESDVTYRDPLFETRQSRHLEDGDQLEVDLSWELGKFTLEGRYSTYDSDGAVPFTQDSASLGVQFEISEHFGAVFQARQRDYSEDPHPHFNYEADMLALLLQWKR